MFERNPFTWTSMQANCIFLHKNHLSTVLSLDYYSCAPPPPPLPLSPPQKKKNNIMSLNRPTGHGNITNFIQIDREICEKMRTEVSAFSYKCDLEEHQDHSNWYHNIQFSGVYHCTNFERNQYLNVRMLANVKVVI